MTNEDTERLTHLREQLRQANRMGDRDYAKELEEEIEKLLDSRK